MRDHFFYLIDKMIAKLFERAQDPLDTAVDASFHWQTFAEIPAANKYNMDEMGSDTNKELQSSFTCSLSQAARRVLLLVLHLQCFEVQCSSC